MVMEETPSPQCVGREFVRQYYTLLNRAPAHLHRFYNNYSSFVHGGLDSNRESNPAIGQKQIHQKIQALNFQDCHAKINQVDSQSTLGNGVVVQVSGELSNAGHPMRRFTQTFVLASQAPKKYYVHNDIFRYQDFGYADEEEEEIEGEGNVNEPTEREGEEHARVEAEEENHQNQGQQLSAKISNVEQHSPNQQQQLPPITQQQQIYYAMPPQPQLHPVMQQVTINGSVHEDSSIISQQPLQQQPPLQQQQQQQYIAETTTQEQFQQESEQDSVSQQQQQQQSSIKIDSHSVTEENHEQPEGDRTYAPSAPTEIEIEHQVSSQNTNSGPKTYANLVKSHGPKQSISPPPLQSMRIDDRIPAHQPTPGPPLPVSSSAPINQHIHRMGSVQQQQTQQQQYQQRVPRPGGPMQRDGERRSSGRPGGYTDAHQLFLGNLPHDATESDLRRVFEVYGRVADLRVHSKQGAGKGPQGTNSKGVPNYGFITFEDISVVKLVLADCPIYFPNDKGQKLNIEEKKTRPREGGGSDRRPNLGGDGNMRPMGGQQQQQPQQRGPGGPGMMRGNQHGTRGRGGFNRGGGEGGRGGIRQPGGNPNNQNYQNRR